MADSPPAPPRTLHIIANGKVAGDPRLREAVRVVRERVVVLACLDNLVRGASGVAVQNFNRMMGYDERTGLL